MKIINVASYARNKVNVKICVSLSTSAISDTDRCRFKVWLRLDNTFTEILETSIWRSQWRSEIF